MEQNQHLKSLTLCEFTSLCILWSNECVCAMHMVCLKDVQAAGVPLTITFTLAFLNLGLRCLHVQRRLKWNEAYPHQLVAASMSILDSFAQLFLCQYQLYFAQYK
jgi:hypothetical protein